jgi:hypothetical protein
MFSDVGAKAIHVIISIARFAHLVKETPFLDFTSNSVYNDFRERAQFPGAHIPSQSGQIPGEINSGAHASRLVCQADSEEGSHELASAALHGVTESTISLRAIRPVDPFDVHPTYSLNRHLNLHSHNTP